METKTEELTNCFFKPIKYKDGTQLYTIEFNDGTDQSIQIKLTYETGNPAILTHTFGLNNGQYLDVELQGDNKTGYFTYIFQAKPNEGNIETDIVAESIEVLAKNYAIRKMSKKRISEIAEIIFKLFSESLINRRSEESHKLESFECFKESNSVVYFQTPNSRIWLLDNRTSSLQ